MLVVKRSDDVAKSLGFSSAEQTLEDYKNGVLDTDHQLAVDLWIMFNSEDNSVVIQKIVSTVVEGVLCKKYQKDAITAELIADIVNNLTDEGKAIMHEVVVDYLKSSKNVETILGIYGYDIDEFFKNSEER